MSLGAVRVTPAISSYPAQCEERRASNEAMLAPADVWHASAVSVGQHRAESCADMYTSHLLEGHKYITVQGDVMGGMSTLVDV